MCVRCLDARPLLVQQNPVDGKRRMNVERVELEDVHIYVALLSACKSAPVPQLPSGWQLPVPIRSQRRFPPLPFFTETSLGPTLNPTWQLQSEFIVSWKWVLVIKVHFSHQ